MSGGLERGRMSFRISFKNVKRLWWLTPKAGGGGGGMPQREARSREAKSRQDCINPNKDFGLYPKRP